ncbi:MAG: serine/threonine-protein kinase [Pseudanabaenaceae cyanobacterium]
MAEKFFPQIKGYRVLGTVGRGQFGRVLCAYQQDTGRLVALKELDKYRFPTNKLLRELRFMIDSQHPNIIKCETILFAEGYRYLVMEYCEAGTLRDLMLQTDQLTVNQRLSLIIDILQGLAHAHRLGIVHCDIKPENILLQLSAQGWIVKVSDFGIAHLEEELQQNLSNRTGSPAYMAPERFYGQFSPSSDLYAVGIILYELFMQERPFHGTVDELMTAHLNHRPSLGQLPLPLQEVLSKALAKLPAQRFGSAEEMAEVLDRLRHKNAISFPVSVPQIQLVTVPPVRIEAQITDAVIWEGELLVAVDRQLLALDGQTGDRQVIRELPAPIRSLQVHGAWVYAQTTEALYRFCADSPVQLLCQSAPLHFAVSANWLVVGSGGQLTVHCLISGKVRPYQFSNHQILDVQVIDSGHLVALTQKQTTDQHRLVVLNRRGQLLGKLSLPGPVKKMYPTPTPYRFLVLEAGPIPSLLLMDLYPYRLNRTILSLTPHLAVATPWGHAIASTTVLMLVDLTGQSLANLQLPEPIIKILSLGQCQLLVITQAEQLSYCYRLDLAKLGIDLIC